MDETTKNRTAEPIAFSVSQITEYISRKMFSDPFLSSVKVVGEVTNLSLSSVGHAFFSLKDENAMLDCIIYDYGNYPDMDVIADGALLEIKGRIAFYRKTASVQLVVESAVLGGVGDLFARFERNKHKLLKEGIFSEAHKKPLPEFALKIGVVTSPSGAVLHDIINVATRRFEGIHIMVYPVHVQGADAAPQICRGIQHFNRHRDVDVIIVARGGGSIEDLAPFNEECVARAVYASELPVVSAVGHETDFTLCDMAADMRAPTPSAAAEMIVREKKSLTDSLERQKRTLRDALVSIIQAYEIRLSNMVRSVSPQSLRLMLNRAGESVDANGRLIKSGIYRLFDNYELRLEKYRDRLEDLSPLRVLERGYAVVYGKSGMVTSAAKAEDDMLLEFADGRVAVSRKKESNG